MLDLSEGILLPACSQGDVAIPRASAGHCTTQSVLGEDQGVRIEAQSWLELCNIHLLNANRRVSHLKEQQVFRFGWNPRSLNKHIFDVVAFMHDGLRIAYTVKPEVFLHRSSKRRGKDGRILDNRSFLEKMGEIAWWAVEETRTYDDVRLITNADINQVDLRNAEIYARVREADPVALAEARRVVADLPDGGGKSLRDLTLDAGADPQVYRALLHLMRKGELRCIAHEIITPKSIVIRTDC